MRGQNQSTPQSADRRISIRLRLTLWNIGVLLFILFGMGTVLRYALQASLLSSVDHDMQHNAQGMLGFLARNGHLPPPPVDVSSPPAGPPNGELGPRFFDANGTPVSLTNRNSSAYDPAGFRETYQTARPVSTTVVLMGRPFRILSYPLHRANGTVEWVVQLPRSLAETNGEIGRLTRLLFLLAGPGVLLAGVGGSFLTTRALRPVRQITHAAARIEAEDLSGRLAVAGRDELSELSATFNGMLARLEESFRQRQIAYVRMERAYEQQQRFTADASHELKSPLTVIEGTISLNLSGGERTPEQYRRALETVGRSAKMMSRIVQDLLLLARSDAGELVANQRTVSLYDILTLAQEAVGEDASGHDREPSIVLPDRAVPAYVSVDPNHLVRLFVNLFDNALRHTPAAGRIAVSLTTDESSVTSPVIVAVADTGEGISPEALPHIFDRFYRVDSARARSHGGTGLGLAICRSIAEAYGGTLQAESAPGVGSTFYLSLPRVIATSSHL